MPYLNWDSPSKWFRRKWHQNMDQFKMYFYWTWPGFIHFSSRNYRMLFWNTWATGKRLWKSIHFISGIKLAENSQMEILINWISGAEISTHFFGIFTPENWGIFMIQFDGLASFFRMGWFNSTIQLVMEAYFHPINPINPWDNPKEFHKSLRKFHQFRCFLSRSRLLQASSHEPSVW